MEREGYSPAESRDMSFASRSEAEKYLNEESQAQKQSIEALLAKVREL